MKIERVVKKDDANVIIFFNNEEKLFLSYEVFLQNRLKKDMEISEDGFSFLIRENQKYFIKKKALELLGRRLHSYSELRLKLMQKKYDRDLIGEVLDQLREKGILDDYRFGRQYAEEKIRLKSWGRNKLKAELIRKGVAPAIIDDILTEEDTTPEENAKVIALKKLKLLSKGNYNNRELSSRLSAYLYSKGYDFDTIREVVRVLITEDDSI